MLKVLVSLTLIIAASCWLPYAVEDHIISLGEPTFWDARGQFGGHGLLVYFYDSQTCRDCKQFESEYKAVAASLNQSSIVNVSKVDCYVEKRFCFFEGLVSYPSIYLYTWNYKVEYAGPRTAAAIEKWVKKNVDSVYEDISTDEQLFKRFSSAILLSDSADDMAEIAAAVKELSSEVEVAYASKNYRQGLGENGGIVTQGGLVEKLPNNVEQIKNRVREVNIPNFGPREAQEMRWGVSRDYIFYFRTTKFNPKSESAKAFDKLRKDFGSRFGFYYVNTVDDVVGSALAKRFGVQSDGDVAVGIASQEGNIVKKYKKDQITTEASIRGMIDDFLERKLKRHYMSAPVPVKNPKDLVVELVGSTYSNVVHDPTKNVLVLMYTPECQDCTRVDLIFRALAYRYREINNLVFAKMDATENEVDGFDFYSYPAVIFCEGKPDAKPTEYIYDKTMTGFKSFLEKPVPRIKEVEL